MVLREETFPILFRSVSNYSRAVCFRWLGSRWLTMVELYELDTIVNRRKPPSGWTDRSRAAVARSKDRVGASRGVLMETSEDGVIVLAGSAWNPDG